MANILEGIAKVSNIRMDLEEPFPEMFLVMWVLIRCTVSGFRPYRMVESRMLRNITRFILG
jgi:hypothetical protein